MATPTMRVLAAAVILLLVAPACDGAGPNRPRTTARRPQGASESPRGRAKKSVEPRERAATDPGGVHLENKGLTVSDRRRVRRAVQDLKDLGFWRELTSHVASVTVATRPGPERAPADGHLADALMTVRLGRFPGYSCDIMIFSQALEDDVANQAIYYSEGRLSAPPPTLGQFWAIILAHELAHCSPRGRRGEAYSTKWEQRVLEAFGTSRLGTPGS